LGGHRLAGQRGRSAAELLPEVRGEKRDVLAPPSERRKLDARHGETEEEHVAKATGMYLAVEVAARGGDDAHVDARPALAADAPDLGSLDGAEQFGLQGNVEIADLVDEERSLVRLLEEARGRDVRAGER